MLNWLSQNISTILIALGLFCLCFAIIRKILRDKKQGKTSCGCGCSGCAMKDMCHAQNPQAEQKKKSYTTKAGNPRGK
ncbi:MAG: FeoB-associated Cys-rich membrane protein [Clostridia bacterium]|nr:FeoB-associated Cys-rich membrane protein [Clostridia bacterium]